MVMAGIARVTISPTTPTTVLVNVLTRPIEAKTIPGKKERGSLQANRWKPYSGTSIEHPNISVTAEN